MGQIVSVCEIYRVEGGPGDWPAGLPESEQKALTEVVRSVILRWQETGNNPCTYDLYKQASYAAEKRDDLPVFRSGVMLDWLYACVVRAARHCGADQVWSVPRPTNERWVTFKLNVTTDKSVNAIADFAAGAALGFEGKSALQYAAWKAISEAVRRTVRR